MRNIIKKIFVLLILGVMCAGFGIKSKVRASHITDPDILYPTCYQQGDDRWASHLNGGEGIGPNGCGILSTVNAVNYLTGNFINPMDLADYAYSIDAYNGSMGGGTARYILYNRLGAYEEKYGFKVVNTSVNGGVKEQILKDHLANGGVSIAYVPGHFIALVDYNATKGEFLVYDSAANITKRYTYPAATWLTEGELSSGYMEVSWFCLLSKTTTRDTSLGNDAVNKINGKVEETIYVNKNKEDYAYISGTALESRGIIGYYYELDYDKTYPLNVAYNDVDLTNYPLCNAYAAGFNGTISVKELSLGSHYLNVYAKTKDNGVCNVAEINLIVSGNDPVSNTSRTFTFSMNMANGQPDIINGWQDIGFNDYIFRANYNTTIYLGQLDLSLFKEARIYYTTSAAFDADESGIQSVIGLKKEKVAYGYYGKNVDFSYDIAHANMTDGVSSGWSEFRTAVLDLSSIDYRGKVFVNGYNQQNLYYAVSKIEFVYKDEVELDNPTLLDNASSNYLEIAASKEIDANKTITLGTCDLKDYTYVEVHTDSLSDITLLGNNDYKIPYLKMIEVNGKRTYLYRFDNLDYKGILKIKNDSLGKITVDAASFKDEVVKEQNESQILLINGHDSFTNEASYAYVNTELVHEIVEATCLTAGYDKTYCLISTYTNTVIYDALGHTGEDLYYDDGSDSHYHMCDRCYEKFGYEEHEFKYEYNKAKHWLVCECGYKKDVVKHTFDPETHLCICGLFDPSYCAHEHQKTVPGTPATCTKPGTTEQIICEDCNRVLKESTEIPALGHDFVDGYCTRCNEKDPNYVPVNNTEPSPKKSCKKSLGIYTISLLTALSLSYVVLRKKD